MSQQIDHVLVVVIALLLVLIVVLVVALAGLFIYLYKNRNNQNIESQGPAHPIPSKKVDYIRCSVHTEKKSVGLCAICESSFCEDCLKENDKLNFCPEHYRTFLENKWAELQTVKTTPDTPKDGIFLYKFKSDLLKEGVPTYIVTHYTINVHEDYIESYVTIYTRAQDYDSLRTRLDSTIK